MGSISIFKPLSTFLLPAPLINLCNVEINIGERWVSNLGRLDEKQEIHLCAIQLPSFLYFYFSGPLNYKNLWRQSYDHSLSFVIQKVGSRKGKVGGKPGLGRDNAKGGDGHELLDNAFYGNKWLKSLHLGSLGAQLLLLLFTSTLSW